MSEVKKKKQNFSKGKKKEKEPEEKSEEEKLAEFEVEVIWCIEQLENGLSNPKKKTDPKQTQEALKIIKILQNPSAPLVKKRQLMRTTFGDYRKTIAAEQKRFTSAARKIKFKPTDEASPQESKFIRKSDTSSPNTSEKQSGDGVKTDSTDSSVTTVSVTKTTEDEEEAGSSLDSKATKDEKQAGSSVDSNYDINKSFKLDFNINKEDDATENKISNDENQEDGCSVGEDGVISEKIKSSNAGSNTSEYFKMSTSDNSFRFNFKVS